MRLFNSLTRKVEEIVPEEGKIGMYTCGPTVYSTPTIGNFRTYTLSDLLSRSLRYLGYEVLHVMNLTDVGHLTGDNQGDADKGEDRLEKAAKREGRSAWDIAAAYTNEFYAHMSLLNIERPSTMCKATDHIEEQIALVQKLWQRGLAYSTSDGVYFDTVAFEKMGYKYGELSTLDKIREGARVEANTNKHNPRDFALWKLSPRGAKRDMEWESPWGVGFPGWHIECSAMSMRYLGEQFDLHIGGEDLRSTHHPNEIAQAEGATGKHPFVKTWVHGAFLLVDGGRMGKSLGNAYTVADVTKRGIDPLALRYFYLTGHYRKQLNFTWEALAAAERALERLREIYTSAKGETERSTLSSEKNAKMERMSRNFRQRVEDDLDMPGALAVLWEVAKSNIPGRDKAEFLVDLDGVLGVGVDKVASAKVVPEEVRQLMIRREELRLAHKWEEADAIRVQIEEQGYEVEDKASAL